MDDMEMRIQRSIKKRRVLNLIILGFIFVGILFYYIRLPISTVSWFVPFKVESPSFIPLNVENSYAKVVGFDRVKLVYESTDDTLTTWVTTQIGWSNVSSWDEKVTLVNGTPAYYNETDEVQMISWRLEDVEYAIDFTGSTPVPKEELIKIASSIK